MKGLVFLKELATIAPEQLFRYAMDFDRQTDDDRGVTRWETTEPGSLSHVLNALAMSLKWIRERKMLNVVDLQAIHTICSSHLPSYVYPGQFRVNRVKFLILPENTTEEGISYFADLLLLSADEKCEQGSGEITLISKNTFETPEERIKEAFKKNKDVTYHAPMAGFNTDTINTLITFNKQLDNTYKQYSINDRALATWVTLYDLYPNLLSQEHEDFITTYYKNIDELHRFFQNKINGILTVLYQQLDLPLLDRQKLHKIAQAVQDLERLHPFRDVNCRSFCVVFLIILLIQNNFLPPLIDNINKFDGYDVSSLVKLIEDGIKRTEDLQSYIQSKTDTGVVIADELSWCVIPDSLKPRVKDIAHTLKEGLLSSDFSIKESLSSSDDSKLVAKNQECIDVLMQHINVQFPGLNLAIHNPNLLPSVHQFLMELKPLFLYEGEIQNETILIAYSELKSKYSEYMKNFSDQNSFVNFIQNGKARYAQEKQNSPVSLLKRQPPKSALRIHSSSDTPALSDASSQNPNSPTTPLFFKDQADTMQSEPNPVGFTFQSLV